MFPTLNLSARLANACSQPWSYLDLLIFRKGHSRNVLFTFITCRKAEHVETHSSSGACKYGVPSWYRDGRGLWAAAAPPLQRDGRSLISRSVEYSRLLMLQRNVHLLKRFLCLRNDRLERVQDERVLPLLEIDSNRWLRKARMLVAVERTQVATCSFHSLGYMQVRGFGRQDWTRLDPTINTGT